MKDLTIKFFINDTEIKRLEVPSKAVVRLLPHEQAEHYRSLIQLTSYIGRANIKCDSFFDLLEHTFKLLSALLSKGEDSDTLKLVLDMFLCQHLLLNPYKDTGEITIDIIALTNRMTGDKGAAFCSVKFNDSPAKAESLH